MQREKTVKRVQVGFTEAQYQAVAQRAAEASLTVSAYIRTSLVNEMKRQDEQKLKEVLGAYG